MDRWVRNAAMAMAQSTTRRGFLSTAARGLVGAGLGAGFLFGGQRMALANNCRNLQVFQDCNGWNCSFGDSEGCSTATYGQCRNCNGLDCPTGYTQVGYWTCCCGSSLYNCTLCESSTGSDCECNGGGGTSC